MKKFNEFTEAYVGQAVNSADKKTIKTTGPDGKPYFKQVAAKRNLTQEKIPKLADEKYSDTFNKKPSVTNITNEQSEYDEYGMYMGSNDNEDEGEYDYEGDMAMSQLRTIIRNSQMMLGMMERDTNLPEWVQSKLTLAEDYIMSSANYLMSRYEEDE